MREILFRGKRVDNGEWVQGDLVQGVEKQQGLLFLWCKDKHSPTGIFEFNIIPETVGQYTGLTDKNGTKIFEGDIVLTQEMYDKPYSKNRKSKKHIGVVEYRIRSGSGFYNPETGEWDKYKEYEAEWIVNVKDYGKFVHSSWGDFYDCEVIGNIHDNPELLKERERA